MIHIILHSTLGFGSGGWDAGYHIYGIEKGKSRLLFRTVYPTVYMELKSILRFVNVKYRIHQLSLTDSDKIRDNLIKKLCDKTRM
jgi:hypothetical protein